MQLWRSPLLFALCQSTALVASLILQIPMEPTAIAKSPYENAYGWRYPGIYRIINYSFEYAAAINETDLGAAVASQPLQEYDDTQIWLIAYLDDSKKNVFIINKANGGYLTAIEGKKVVRGYEAAPYDKRAQWTMDFDTFDAVEGKPVVLSNRGIKGVLDLAGSRHDAGAPILVWPKYRNVPRNQGWYLQYMKEYVA
ncbi:hypothetical protein XPA_000656 [Xanthoria parietina]